MQFMQSYITGYERLVNVGHECSRRAEGLRSWNLGVVVSAKLGLVTLQSFLVDVRSAQEASENRGKQSFVLEHWVAEIAADLLADL